MKNYFFRLAYFISVLSLLLFFGCKNNAGPNLDEGRIKAITITEGDNTEGYMLQFNENQQQEIASNDTLIYDNQEYGTYEITLDEVPENCSVSGENPVTVLVENQDEITVTFEVSCTKTPTETGSLEVITNTSVINSEEIYTFTFNNEKFEIDAIDTLLIENIDFGNYTVELSNFPGTCNVTNNSIRDISIQAESTSSIEFDLFCQTIFNYKFIASTAREEQNHLFFLNPDGKTEKITRDFGNINAPALSPDRSKIAFTASPVYELEDELYIMNTDGTNIQKITKYPTNPEIYNFSWAPNSSSIVFSGRTGETSSIFSIDIDGSDLIELTNHPDSSDVSPSWAPDGSKIVFHRRKGDFADIYLMDPDGTDVTNITHSPNRLDVHPHWTPDGKKIYFLSVLDDDEVTMIYDLNTSQISKLLDSEGDDVTGPVWSPDGSKITYMKTSTKDRKYDTPGYNIYVMNADGSNPTKLTKAGELIENTSPNWSPDGTKIAFTRTDWGWGMMQPYVMNADGTEINNLGVEALFFSWIPID